MPPETDVLYAFAVTCHGETRVLDTDWASAAAACQAALITEVALRRSVDGDRDATVEVIPLNGARPCAASRAEGPPGPWATTRRPPSPKTFSKEEPSPVPERWIGSLLSCSPERLAGDAPSLLCFAFGVDRDALAAERRAREDSQDQPDRDGDTGLSHR